MHHTKTISLKSGHVLINESAGIIKSADSPESARFVEPAGSSRIVQILPYPLDSPNPTDYAHGFFKIEPPSPTVHHSSGISAGKRIHRRESLRTSSGSWGVDLSGLRALYMTVVSRPVSPCGLLVYGHGPFNLGHRPFSLAHGHFIVMRLRALFYMPTGPLSFCGPFAQLLI